MRSKRLTFGLLIFYLLFLTWIIIFKLQYSLDTLPYIRNINVIPFAQSVIINDRIQYSEIIYNAIVFLPFGILISILWEKKSFFIKVLPIFCTSLAFEIIQFIFAIGATDITDLLMNTLGGIVGVGLFYLIAAIWKKHCIVLINSIALLCAIGMTLFIGIILFFNL